MTMALGPAFGSFPGLLTGPGFGASQSLGGAMAGTGGIGMLGPGGLMIGAALANQYASGGWPFHGQPRMWGVGERRGDVPGSGEEVMDFLDEHGGWRGTGEDGLRWYTWSVDTPFFPATKIGGALPYLLFNPPSGIGSCNRRHGSSVVVKGLHLRVLMQNLNKYDVLEAGIYRDILSVRLCAAKYGAVDDRVEMWQTPESSNHWGDKVILAWEDRPMKLVPLSAYEDGAAIPPIYVHNLLGCAEIIEWMLPLNFVVHYNAANAFVGPALWIEFQTLHASVSVQYSAAFAFVNVD